MSAPGPSAPAQAAASARASTAPLLDLPRELLQSILSQVPPEGVAALTATCTSLRAQLRDAYIWRQVYACRFDVPPLARQHWLLHEPPGWMREARKGGRVHKGKMREESKGEANAWEAEEQTMRLALAVKKVRIGAACELDLLNHQADTVRALLAAAVSMAPRAVQPGDFNERDLSSQTARTLTRLFSDAKWGKVAYSNWVYPRESATALAAHHRSMVREERKLLSSAPPELDEARRVLHADRGPGTKGSVQALPPALRKVWREGKQRSPRLYKKPGDVPLMDEEAAAHLHCLHGPRDYLVAGAENDSEDEANDGDGWPSRTMRAELGAEYGTTTTRPGRRQACIIRETVFQDAQHGMRNVDWNHEFRVKEVPQRDFTAEGSSAVHLDAPVTDSEDDEERIAAKRLYLPALKNLEGGFSLGSKAGSEGDALLRAAARRIVYDVSRFGWENGYGPFHVFRPSPARRRSSFDEQGGEASARSDGPAQQPMTHPEVASVNSFLDSPPAGAKQDAHGSEASDEEGYDSDEEGESDETDDDEAWDVEDFRILVSRAYGSVPRRLARAMRANNEVLPKKRIDWLVVEAAQVVMHCNLFHAQLHGWGAGFFDQVANPYALTPQLGMPKSTVPSGQQAPDGLDDDLPDDSIELHETAELWARATHTLCTPRGWDHSRGEEMKPWLDSGSAKPAIRDWAHVEGVWCGTFAFLPYADWILYNASTALERGYRVHRGDERELLPPSTHTLASESEAIGDFVQIRLSLVPPPAEGAEPVEDAQFPPLYFEGHTLRHDMDGTTAVRGYPRGVVRPVFAPDQEGQECRAIEGIHWTVVHSYDDAERWKLEGVQAGQPGTRAAVYGIWTDAERDEKAASTPCGAWCYWRVDDRKWRDVEAEITKSKTRVHNHRGSNWY